MGRYGNYPTTVEDCKTISITKLNEWNYLSYGNRSGTITWSTNGIENSSIGIVSCINESEKYIKLNYKTSTESISYKVKIIKKISNLGKGYVNYFLCPHTKKLCRKLYFKDGYFLHRTAFNNLMYQSQIESKKSRFLFSIFNKATLPDEVYESRYKKYFKTHYKGKPTKRYLKLEKKIKLAEGYPNDIVEQLLVM